MNIQKTVIKIEGMSCGHCVKAVTDAVSALSGVSEVSVSLEEGTAAVSYDTSLVALDGIKTAIEEQGFDVAG